MIHSEHKNASIIKLGLVMLTTILTASFNINNNPKVINLSLNKTIPLATEIINNEATGNGGGIANNGELIIEDGKISENTSNNGGGLYNNGESTLLGGEISDNEALQDGGGIYSTNSGVVNTSEAMLITGPELNALIPDTANLIVFSDVTAPADIELTDVSMLQDDSIVAWTTDDGTMTISTQKKNAKVYANPDSSTMFLNKDSIQAFDFSNLDTRYVETMQRMFSGISAEHVDISNFNTVNCTDFSGLFLSAHETKEIDITGLNTSSAKTIRFMFAGNGTAVEETMYLENIIGEEDLDLSNCENTQSVFANCRHLTSVDVTDWDMSNTSNIICMFAYCEKLEVIDTSKWNITNKIDSTYLMFNYCMKLKNIAVKHWDMSNVTSVQAMFNKCNSLESLDISGWQTGKCKTFRIFFQNSGDSGYGGKDASSCVYLNIDGIDTSSCEDFGWAFYGLGNLTYLDVSSLDTSNCKNFHHMFSGCACLVLSGYENWDVSKAEYMNATFHSLANEYFDVSKYDTSNCKSFAQMFEYCTNLKQIDGLENFDTSNGEHFYQMFGSSPQLTELNLISFDTTKANDTFIDEQRNAPSDCMIEMFHNLIYLERITLGEKFSFNGNGTDCLKAAVLPTPLGENITGADGHWYNEVTFEQYEPTEVPSLVEATYIVVNPKANLEIFENPDGSTGGVYEPPADEPAEIPEIPEENLPELIEFEFGEFKAVTEYTPGTYEDVEYTYTYTRDIYPVSYQSITWSQWMITKDSEGNVINTEPYEITLDVIDKTYSNYIVYNFDTGEALYQNGVAGDSVQLYTIYNSDVDNVENAIYLAAYLNKQEDTTNNHVAHLVDGIYVDAGLDTQVSEVDKFTETYTQTYTKQIMVEAPSSNTEYVYIPIYNMKAEKGITWSQWLMSDYNTTGQTSDIKIMTSDYVEVSLDSEIQADGKYGFGIEESYELSGTWKFNDILIIEKEIEQEIDFVLEENLNIYYNGAIRLWKQEDVGFLDYLEVFDNDNDGVDDTFIWDTKYEGDFESWINEECQTIDFGSTPQPVSKEFYEWFTANAQPCLSGTYKWNDKLELPQNNLEQQIYFDTESEAIEKIIVSDYVLMYFDDDNDPIVIYNTDAGFSLHSTIMQFGDINQPVSLEFYEWFNANAQRQLEAGLYDINDNLLCSWETLVNDYGFDIGMNPLTHDDGTTFHYIMTNKAGDTYSKCTKLVIDDSITYIGDRIFMDCTLLEIIIPDSVDEISKYVFMNSNITHIELNGHVGDLYQMNFYGCDLLEKVTLGESITSTGFMGFADCVSLHTVNIMSNNIDFSISSFENCESLTTINFNGTKEEWNSNTFRGRWNTGCPEITVHCTDGDIIIPIE